MRVNGFEIDDETEEELAKREAALEAMSIEADEQMAECEKHMNEEDYVYVIYDEWDMDIDDMSIEVYPTLKDVLYEAKGRLCKYYTTNRGKFWYPEHYSLMGKIDKEIAKEHRLFEKCTYHEEFSYDIDYHVVIRAKKKETDSLERNLSYIKEANDIAYDMWYSN